MRPKFWPNMWPIPPILNCPKKLSRRPKGSSWILWGARLPGYTLAKEEFNWIYDLVKEMGGNPESTVFLAGMKTSSAQAALVNGALIHTVDFDDTHMGSIAHLGAPVVSSALAMGEKTGADGPSIDHRPRPGLRSCREDREGHHALSL